MAMLRARLDGNMVITSTHDFGGKDEDFMESLLGSMKGLKNENVEADAKQGKKLLEDMMANGDSG